MNLSWQNQKEWSSFLFLCDRDLNHLGVEKIRKANKQWYLDWIYELDPENIIFNKLKKFKMKKILSQTSLKFLIF